MTIEWTKEGIVQWLHVHDIYGAKTPSEQKAFENAFVDEANKHQDSSIDRKLYRKGLKIIEASSHNKEQAIQKLMVV